MKDESPSLTLLRPAMVAINLVKASSRTRDKSPRQRDRLARPRPGPHNCGVRLSLIRRLTSLLVALAFLASAQVYAMPMTTPAAADATMAGMTHGLPADNCKNCGRRGAPTTADCTAMCAAVFALAPVPVEQSGVRDIPRVWTSETLSARAIAPDTSPPRA